jgi:hypothetical protein
VPRNDCSVAVDALACLALLTLALGGASAHVARLDTSAVGLDRHAGEYVSLVDALGLLDPDSVDAPPRRRDSVLTLDQISNQARTLAAHLRDTHSVSFAARATGLAAQLDAVALRADQLRGRTPTFAEELRRLLGVNRNLPGSIPRLDESHARLERLLAGSGPLARRLDAYQRRFLVPRGRLNRVVMRALAACRAQTTRRVTLPPEETIAVEYVADRPWSGYSVYHGGYRSTIQINRVFPLSVAQLLTLACHEGYPGHHVYNILRDREIVRGRGWMEAAVLPVFSPEGFRAEAIVTAAAAQAFSREERITLFRDDLFPTAGLDVAEVERYVDVVDAVDALTYAIADVVIGFLQGDIGRDETARLLRDRALMEHPEATLAFVERYRAYTLAYAFGREWLQGVFSARDADSWSNLVRLIVAGAQP